ncbi:hypothetical protein ACI789_17720 [Geodermatophilus sp. SYSU D00965]
MAAPGGNRSPFDVVVLAASAGGVRALIRYTRGRTTVVDADGLHEVACECYDLLQAESERLLAPGADPAP